MTDVQERRVAELEKIVRRLKERLDAHVDDSRRHIKSQLEKDEDNKRLDEIERIRQRRRT